ncbi:GNAT family N-acetyltransferase [Deinococcus arenicola]|uniref:GNAT family N-acetyltransferase n=1 Tax=Deinococcus arenicola TaxID=2994950 RepID=A0ABU4DQ87_9DEIO|nr:GNAT family N-acetyltransferase [Deinococcus sp. ZS9-10]MDV6374137.1 GNAT family N-acetyltransferase [Deinococcus sp. ZS9-10]
MPELVTPSAQYRKSFLEAVREMQAEGGGGLASSRTWDTDEIAADFDAFLQHLRRLEPPAGLPEGWVHSSEFWLVDGDTYLGRADLRHSLTPGMREFGGHIGYEVWPSARRQGYGKMLLRLTLERAQELGIERVLITCDAENLGSRGVIEGNGGVLEGEFRLDLHPRPFRRYWITL